MEGKKKKVASKQALEAVLGRKIPSFLQSLSLSVCHHQAGSLSCHHRRGVSRKMTFVLSFPLLTFLTLRKPHDIDPVSKHGGWLESLCFRRTSQMSFGGGGVFSGTRCSHRIAIWDPQNLNGFPALRQDLQI